MIALFIFSGFLLLGAIGLLLFIRSDAYKMEKALYDRYKKSPRP